MTDVGIENKSTTWIHPYNCIYRNTDLIRLR